MIFRPFRSFCNAYANQECFVIGRGPTRYEYSDLTAVRCPIFFINDAVALEKFTKTESFFFAHDLRMACWLKRGIKSTAVLPRNRMGKIISGPNDPALNTASCPILLYNWRTVSRTTLLQLSRDALRDLGELYEHSGTIHSLLHFVWYCGFTRVNFIGCDGISNYRAPYDSRIPNLSESSPFSAYRQIFAVQEYLCKTLRLDRKYLGSPEKLAPTQVAHIPKIIHFIWFGESVPDFVLSIINRTRALLPGWKVLIWRDFPPDFPADILRLTRLLQPIQQQTDIFRVWLLLKHGGIYLDTDIYLLRSLDELRYFDHFFVYEKIDADKVANNAIGSSPGHLLFKRLWLFMSSRLTYPGRNLAAPESLALTHFCNSCRTTILPSHYFYIFKKQKTVLGFLRLRDTEQSIVLGRFRDCMRDDVPPFAVHTWGIPTKIS
jgi:hypothetical protein